MLDAILHNGTILPLGPLPPDWQEGDTLEVARKKTGDLDIDTWAELMNRVCEDSPAEEEERMRSAINEHRRLTKDQTRREMGLPE